MYRLNNQDLVGSFKLVKTTSDKSWRDHRALNQDWSDQPTLVGRVIDSLEVTNTPFVVDS